MKDYSVEIARAAHFPNQKPKKPIYACGSNPTKSRVGKQPQKPKRSYKGGRSGSKSPPEYNARADQG